MTTTQSIILVSPNVSAELAAKSLEGLGFNIETIKITQHTTSEDFLRELPEDTAFVVLDSAFMMFAVESSDFVPDGKVTTQNNYHSLFSIALVKAGVDYATAVAPSGDNAALPMAMIAKRFIQRQLSMV